MTAVGAVTYVGKKIIRFKCRKARGKKIAPCIVALEAHLVS